MTLSIYLSDPASHGCVVCVAITCLKQDHKKNPTARVMQSDAKEKTEKNTEPLSPKLGLHSIEKIQPNPATL